MRIAERVTLALIFGLSLWVITTAFRIEVLNAEAGYYLPRRDRSDSKSRIFPNDTAQDPLRDIVQTVGLLQYLLAPALIVSALVSFFNFTCIRARLVAGVAGAFGCIALGLALYRGYLSSVGW